MTGVQTCALPIYITLTELNGSSPVTLSDQIIPQAPGDQTYAFQWDATLGAGQSLVISLTKVIQPEPISLSSLGIALRGGNIIISWTTNAVAGVQLQTTMPPSRLPPPTASQDRHTVTMLR